MRLSYSALNSFNQCPLKYKWQFIDRVKVPPTPDQFFGGLIHQILEIALKGGKILALEELIKYYENNWKKEVFKGEISEKEYHDLGLEMVKNFYADHKPGLTTVLNTEKFFEIYWQDHKIVGKIDRIDQLPTGEIEIIDYKTNKKLPSEDDFKYDWQLPLYAWASQTMFDDQSHLRGGRMDSSQVGSKVPPIKLTFYYLRHNKKIAPPNTKTLEELQKYILDTISKIQRSKHQAQLSPLCGWCEYLHMCEQGKNFLNQKSKVKSQNDNSKSKSYKLQAKSLNLKNSHQQSLF